jgi:PPM family protein phosphatase
MSHILAATVSNAGKIRCVNDDCFLCGSYVPDIFTIKMAGMDSIDHTWATTTKQTACLAVFDGIGEEGSGETAARMAAEALRGEVSRLASLPLDYIDSLVQRYTTRVNEQIRLAGENDPSIKGSGASFVSLFLRGSKAVVFNLGNSHAYLMRNNQIRHVSKHYWPDIVQSAAGSDHFLGRMPGDRPVSCETSGLFSLEDQDCLLLCTNGLAEAIDEVVMRDCLGMKDPQKAADKLVKQALEKGCPVNVTVMVIRWILEDQPYPKREFVPAETTRETHPRDEQKRRREIQLPAVTRPKVSPPKVKYQRLWEIFPYWMQIISLIALLILLVFLGWLLFRR